jgi:hypothetical protein
MTALLLEERVPCPCEVTILEATPRLGGKIVTREFSKAPIRYEAGAAELYDYSQLGPDPLRELVASLGLTVRPMEGQTVVMDDRILSCPSELRNSPDDRTWRALRDFRSAARRAISPAEYYESDWKEDNRDPLSREKFYDLLSRVKDDTARRYIETLVHSDLATEPHLTNATYGLQNYLMNEPDYMRLYSIEGGNELLPRAIADRIKSHILLNHRVTRVEKTPHNLYRVTFRTQGEVRSIDFDYLVMALPNNWLPAIAWGGSILSRAMHEHHVFYDYPAHYLRVTILFERAFWRRQISGSYFMLDGFGGCCVYDEGARNSATGYGSLGWLIAGEAALSMSNCDDATLIDSVLDTLPPALAVEARRCCIEGRVHRWVGTVNGLPAGFPAREPDSRHQPEPVEHPELFVVGDYLFDSTINGVLDSADVVAEWIREDIAESIVPAVEVAAVPAEPAPAPLPEAALLTPRAGAQ